MFDDVYMKLSIRYSFTSFGFNILNTHSSQLILFLIKFNLVKISNISAG